jgi:hypothetical protein
MFVSTGKNGLFCRYIMRFRQTSRWLSSFIRNCEITGNAEFGQNASNRTPNQVQSTTLAGTLDGGVHSLDIRRHEEFRLGLPSNHATCRLPIMLNGAKCYTDASLSPDTEVENPRKAGLGIFILDPVHQQKFFITA